MRYCWGLNDLSLALQLPGAFSAYRWSAIQGKCTPHATIAFRVILAHVLARFNYAGAPLAAYFKLEDKDGE